MEVCMDYTVCVVEDEGVSRTMIIEMLKKMGISKIVTSTDGQIAPEKLKSQKADLIISDWHMPVMDGMEFFKAVKKEEAYEDTPFLMVTVEDSKEKVVEASTIGIRDYIGYRRVKEAWQSNPPPAPPYGGRDRYRQRGFEPFSDARQTPGRCHK